MQRKTDDDRAREALEAWERKARPPSDWSVDWDAAPEPEPAPPPRPRPNGHPPQARAPVSAAPEPQPPQRELFTRATAIEPRPVEWLLPGWLPRGELSILSGRPGSQKTTLAAAIVSDLTRGRAWRASASHPAGPAISVLWATSEDSLSRVLVPRLEATGAALERVYFAADGFSPVSEDGLPALRSFADLVPDLGLVVLDPLKSFAAPEDGNSESDVRESLVRITEFATQTGIAVLGISHLRKGGAAESLDALSGSLAWGATARSVWVAGRNPDPDLEGFVLAHSKCNLGPLQESIRYEGTSLPGEATRSEAGWTATSAGLAFEWQGPSALLASELTNPPKPRAPGEDAIPETKLAQAVDWLEAQLRTADGEPQLVAAAMLKARGRGVGFGESTLRIAAQELGAQEFRDGSALNWAHPKWRPQPK